MVSEATKREALRTTAAPLRSATTDTIFHHDRDYIYINDLQIKKDDFVYAFGGSLNPGMAQDRDKPLRKLGDPAPLGLSAFALTTFILSLVNTQAMGLTTSNIVVGSAIFYGGLVQLLAGMWEMAQQNTFGAMALSSYGGFWMSFGAINIPWFGITDAYADDERGLQIGIGFFLLGWAIFTFMLLMATLKSTVALFSMFLALDVTFFLLTIGELAPSVNCTKAGGVFGIITAVVAWYNAYAGLATKENSYITLEAIQLPK